MAEETKTLWGAMLEVQKALPKFPKDGTANYGRYTTLPTLFEGLLPLLNKHELVLSQAVTTIEDEPALTTVLTHVPTDKSIESTMLLLLKSKDPQGQGSAITYAKRYAAAALVGAVADEDDDGQAASPDKPISEPQKKLITELLPRIPAEERQDFYAAVLNKPKAENSVEASKLIDALMKAKAPQ